MRRILVLAIVLMSPGLGLAQGRPERFLSPDSQIYITWDGIDQHRGDFAKTSLGKMMEGETGTFLGELISYLQAASEPLLDQAEPEIADLLRATPAMLRSIARNGFSMSVEVSSALPPQAEAVIVFPRSGGPRGALTAFVKNVLKMNGVRSKELRVDNLALDHVVIDPVNWAFGSDGDTAIMVVGTEDPARVMRRGNDKGNNISKNALHKKVQAFDEFPTWVRGYIDVAAIAKLVGGLAPEAAGVIEVLGVDGVDSLTFHSGFEGPAQLSVVDVNLSGPRRGLMKLTVGRNMTIGELPPLPTDLTAFSAGTFKPTEVYDNLSEAAGELVRIFTGGGADTVKEGIRQAEKLIGLDVRNDVLGSLGDVYANYRSPSDGPLGLGAVTLIKVKDEAKLIKAGQAIKKALPAVPGFSVNLRERSYRGVTCVEIHAGGEGMNFNFTTPTFAIHKGWLVYSNYPQPVHAFILRNQGVIPTWKLDEQDKTALAKFPKEFTSIQYADPRPTSKMLFSWVPALMSAANAGASLAGVKLKEFDVSTIPHPQEVERFLFPNISVTTYDGKKIRYEARASLALPF